VQHQAAVWWPAAQPGQLSTAAAASSCGSVASTFAALTSESSLDAGTSYQKCLPNRRSFTLVNSDSTAVMLTYISYHVPNSCRKKIAKIYRLFAICITVDRQYRQQQMAEAASLASLQHTQAKRTTPAKHVLCHTWRQHLLEVPVQRNAQCAACWRSQSPAPCLLWLYWQSVQPAEAEQTGKSEAVWLGHRSQATMQIKPVLLKI